MNGGGKAEKNNCAAVALRRKAGEGFTGEAEIAVADGAEGLVEKLQKMDLLAGKRKEGGDALLVFYREKRAVGSVLASEAAENGKIDFEKLIRKYFAEPLWEKRKRGEKAGGEPEAMRCIHIGGFNMSEDNSYVKGKTAYEAAKFGKGVANVKKLEIDHPNMGRLYALELVVKNGNYGMPLHFLIRGDFTEASAVEFFKQYEKRLETRKKETRKKNSIRK